MKRITYISRASLGLTREEVEKIAEISRINNKRDGLTGILFVYKDVFYQIIEGEKEELDARFQKILADNRHRDIFVLNIENDAGERKYKNWDMNTVILDDTQDFLMKPVSEMLAAIAESYMTLEKYVPESILKNLQKGINPLSLKPKFQDRIIIFGDLYGSTSVSEIFDNTTTVNFINAFFDICIEQIRKYGGVISKLMGDGFMSYFPITMAEETISSLHSCLEKMENLRNSSEKRDPRSLLHAGFGVSAGRVFEGNIGSTGKMDYTIIGDAVNTASRLQELTRPLKYPIVFDHSVAGLLPDGVVKKIGKIKPRGKEEMAMLYTAKDIPPYAMEYDNLIRKIRELIG